MDNYKILGVKIIVFLEWYIYSSYMVSYNLEYKWRVACVVHNIVELL
jgi:hypothetical protein